MTEHTQRSRVLMIVLISGIALVVIVALIAVFARSGPTEYAADTPEGVVQRYSQAVVDGDYDTAESYISPDAINTCERISDGPSNVRVTLLGTTEHTDTAIVEVRIAANYGSGPLGGSDYEYDSSFRLTATDDGWAVTGAPWDLAICAEIGMG